MKILSVVGARPQYMKLAAMDWRFAKEFESLEHVIIDTGQHYDSNMSADFFVDLNISKPYKNLRVGSGSHAAQTSKMMTGIEEALQEVEPNHVLLYGDTNSTLAGALTASKMNIPISHVEAGLRSFNRRMPEEINRILTDHASSILFAPTVSALQQLKKEGLGDKSFFSGDLIVELLNHVKERLISTNDTPYIFATIHRAENCTDEVRIRHIISEMRKSPIPIHLHCHPRLFQLLQTLQMSESVGSLLILNPLSYFDSVSSIFNSAGVITDSGGVQKEAYLAGKPCLVVRSETEWIETIATGASTLDPMLETVQDFWSKNDLGMVEPSIFGDGTTSRFIIQKIIDSST